MVSDPCFLLNRFVLSLLTVSLLISEKLNEIRNTCICVGRLKFLCFYPSANKVTVRIIKSLSNSNQELTQKTCNFGGLSLFGCSTAKINSPKSCLIGPEKQARVTSWLSDSELGCLCLKVGTYANTNKHGISMLSCLHYISQVLELAVDGLSHTEC